VKEYVLNLQIKHNFVDNNLNTYKYHIEIEIHNNYQRTYSKLFAEYISYIYNGNP